MDNLSHVTHYVNSFNNHLTSFVAWYRVSPVRENTLCKDSANNAKIGHIHNDFNQSEIRKLLYRHC